MLIVRAGGKVHDPVPLPLRAGRAVSNARPAFLIPPPESAMPALLLALALAAPAAPAPLPRPPAPVTRADLAGAYSGTWCGHPISFRIWADGTFVAFYYGHWWYGTSSLRAGVVYVEECRWDDPAFKVRWWFRPARGPKGKLRRHGYACEQGPPPAEKGD